MVKALSCAVLHTRTVTYRPDDGPITCLPICTEAVNNDQLLFKTGLPPQTYTAQGHTFTLFLTASDMKSQIRQPSAFVKLR